MMFDHSDSKTQLSLLSEVQGLDLIVMQIRSTSEKLELAMEDLQGKLSRYRLQRQELEKLLQTAEQSREAGQQELQRLDAEPAEEVSEADTARSAALAAIGLGVVTEADSRLARRSQVERQLRMLDEQVAVIRCDLGSLEQKTVKAASRFEQLGEQLAELDKDAATRAELASLAEKRKALTDGLDRKVLTHYERVRTLRAGIGVASISGTSCGGCNVLLPAQFVRDIQADRRIHTCPRCMRLLMN